MVLIPDLGSRTARKKFFFNHLFILDFLVSAGNALLRHSCRNDHNAVNIAENHVPRINFNATTFDLTLIVDHLATPQTVQRIVALGKNRKTSL